MSARSAPLYAAVRACAALSPSAPTANCTLPVPHRGIAGPLTNAVDAVPDCWRTHPLRSPGLTTTSSALTDPARAATPTTTAHNDRCHILMLLLQMMNALVRSASGCTRRHYPGSGTPSLRSPSWARDKLEGLGRLSGPINACNDGREPKSTNLQE